MERGICDVLADAVTEQVELYKELMKNGRHTDAAICLVGIETLTSQVQDIEDHDREMEFRYPTVTLNEINA